jgi:hypothetical protein
MKLKHSAALAAIAIVTGALGGTPARAAEVGVAVGTPGDTLGAPGDTPTVATFPVDSPATPLSGPRPITGLALAERPVAVDFRPATGGLYLLGVRDSLNTGHLYRLDPVTGVATSVGHLGGLVHADWDIDFDPQADELRVLGSAYDADSTLNRRLDPDTGLAVGGPDAAPDYAPGDVGYVSGEQARLAAGAYTNDATAPTMYVLARKRLAVMGSPGGAPFSASSGLLGSLGGFVDGGGTGPLEGLDISGATGRALALLYENKVFMNLVEMRLTDAATTVLGHTPIAFPTDVAIAPASRIALDTDAVSVEESAGAATLTVTRRGPGSGPVTVAWQLTPQSATGEDVATAGGTVAFAAGESEREIAVPIVDDAASEGAETLSLALGSAAADPPEGAVVEAPGAATITVLASDAADPDPGPVLSAVSISKRVFAPKRPRTAWRAGKRPGTSFRYSLSEPARVSIAIARRRPGRRPRYRRRGALTVPAATAGRNSTRFSGRLRGRPLRPGRYRATLRATDAGGQRSLPRTVSFRVLPG